MIGAHRLAQFGVAAVACLAFAGGASAYLASGGSGSGTGRVSMSLSSLIVSGGTDTQSLLPTGTATGDVAATLVNGNSARVHVASLALDTSQGTGGFSSNAAPCALSFATQTNGGSGWTVPANGSLTIDLVGSVTMGTSAASSCQGQNFTVYLKAT